MKKYPNLFSPLKVGNLTLRNRIVMAPTSGANFYTLTPEGYLTRESIAYYELKAAGGAAAVTIAEGVVHSKTGQHHAVLTLDDPAILPSLARAARAIKRHEAIPSMQLQHAGKHGGFNRLSQSRGEARIRYGPSHEITGDGTEILEMPEELILEIVEAYGKAAAAVKSAGYEMLMVHGGHGWLISQFLSPLENKRKDRFGGSFENRVRLPLMVIDSIRKAVGQDFPIEFRMSGDDFINGGFNQEEGIKFAKLIDGKVDLIHVSAGNFAVREAIVRTHPTMFLEHGCNVYLATAIKKEVKTPVACVGAITDPEQMEEIVASGKADVVALARALIADPYLPKKAAAGRTEEITPCIRCNVCFGIPAISGSMICSVNPQVGNEYENKFAVPPPEKSKKVLIAGGGPGGMQAAITASERGHQVILCEKSSSLGGAIKFAEHVPFKVDLHRFRKHLEYMVRASGTVVMLNTEVTPEFVASQNPDALIVAVGAAPVVPGIPGIHNKKVVMANDIHNADVRIGNRVVILGGGMVGCEEGIYLAMKGKDVTVVEMLDDVAQDVNRVHRIALMLELQKYVKVVTNTKGKAVTEEGLLCEGPDGKEVLYKADTVICAVGQKALTSVVDKLRGTAPEFYWVGDCVKPQKVTEAIRTGYDTAMDL
jgi:2,4-dienoyl-CoA reductase-like NADH-dependent reductase (Old Yellow Enzyme family)/thioredoxin reductase